MKLSIPIIPTILWLEINYCGKTILPELLTLTYLLMYFILKLFWRKNEKIFINYFNYLN
jgi:hypothetical protein